MSMKIGDRRLREVTVGGLLAFLLASAMAVNGQSVSDFDRFQLSNACRPMGLRGSFGGSGHEDTFDFKGLTESVLPDVRSRLRKERLYSPFESASKGSFLKVSVHVAEGSSDDTLHVLSLEYHKLVTDSNSGLENMAATWVRGSSGHGGRDPEFIRDGVTRTLDMFLEEYLRVNEEECRPPLLTATGRISCEGQWGGTECWMELTNSPRCYVWNGALLPEQAVTWTGECAGGFAQGQGTLTWVWDRGRGRETAEETGYLEAGKTWHGRWIRRYGNGTTHEGSMVQGKRSGRWIIRRADGAVSEGAYVEGKRHGRWITRDKSGKQKVVTYNSGKVTARSTSRDVNVSSE